MAKFSGNIGYSVPVEVRPGYWDNTQVTEKHYTGDMISNTRQLQSSDQVNDNINVSNKISIIADPFANQNFHSMKYVWYMGVRWKISRVDVQHPRLILTIGGLYNDVDNDSQ